MGSRGWARIIAGAVLVGAMAAVLAVVSSGRAGNPGQFQFEVFANPQFLTVSPLEPPANQGVVLVRYRPPAGGSSTHVVFTIKVPNALAPVVTSGCSVTQLGDELNPRIFTCDIGTVNGAQVVKRYLLITAPTTAGEHRIDASFTADNGAAKKGGGGFEEGSDLDGSVLKVVPSGNPTRAGTCTGSAATPPVTADDLVSTSISEGVRLSLDVPCPWGFVGEDGPSGKSRTGVSFFGFPQTEAAHPVKWVMTFYSLPAPFNTLSVYFDPSYIAGSNSFHALNNAPLASCTTAPAPPAPACLDSFVRNGRGAIATIIAQGTDVDPGGGVG